MRVTVLVPFSTVSATSTITASSSSSSRQHSPSPSQLHHRRGSLGGTILSTFKNAARSPTTSLLTRRRTVFGDPGWGVVRGLVGTVVCPDELVDALEAFADSEYLRSGAAFVP